MSQYRDFASGHFDRLVYQPPPLEGFWETLSELGWTRDTTDGFVARARARLSLPEMLRLVHQINRLGDALTEALGDAIESGAVSAEPTWEDDIWDATRHAVALGRERYEAALANPATLLEMSDVRPDLGFILAVEDWMEDATDAEVEEALRQGSTVRSMGDPEGMGMDELVEHPELGLGMFLLDEHSPTMWLLFPETHLTTQRHERPARTQTLYRVEGGPPHFWYASLGAGDSADIFVNAAKLGFRQPRVYPPKPSAEARAHFDALIAEQLEAGYTRTHPPMTTLALRVDGAGFENPKRSEELEQRLEKVLREGGFGSLSHVRTTRDTDIHFARVVDHAASHRALRPADTPDSDFVVFHVPEGGEPERLLGSKSLSLEPELYPVDVHEPLPYFSRLSIQPHPETDAWAEDTAEEARSTFGDALDGSLSSLDTVDAHIAALAEEHATGALSADTLEERSQQLGAYAGELVREAVGGDWGVGTLYTERIWFGLLVGEAKIKWWPVKEISQAIRGELDVAFSARCRQLMERADAPRAEHNPARLFPLAAGEGYFDAGVTSDGRQALMAAFHTATFGLFFDADGRLLEYATRPELPGRPEGQPSYGPSRMALEAWQRELGFSPQTIRVRRFSCVQQGVGIEDLPWHYETFLEDPDSEPEGEREETPASLQRWIENGEFVLYWGNDLYVNSEGHVTSS